MHVYITSTENNNVPVNVLATGSVSSIDHERSDVDPSDYYYEIVFKSINYTQEIRWKYSSSSNRNSDYTMLLSLLHAAGGGSGNFSVDEVPAGTIDGVNGSFTTVETPINGSLEVFLNGQKLTNTVDFTYSGNTITMTTLPFSGDIFTINYRY